MDRSILIIDDEIGICTSLAFALEDKYKVDYTTDPGEGIELVKQNGYNLVLLDLRIGNVNGVDVLEKLKTIDNNIAIIMMTAYGTISSSVEAVKKGAYTYMTKPLNLDELMTTIEQALEYQELNKRVDYSKDELKDKYIYNGIIGKSPSMRNVFKLIDKLKDVDTNVVITGESGTGKELVARAIHYGGKRKDNKFVEINCGAIPEGLLEEELFGHKKGTFTGAVQDKVGKFEYANDGTIFLDEIGDMPFALQVKLLRVLQEKEFTPLGANEPVKLNVRVIAATNKDLKSLVDEGSFRSDLYFRLNVVEINIPPLREKKQDLPLLFRHFMQLYNETLQKNVTEISKEAEKCLLAYDYPGNIRELANIIEYCVLLSKDNSIEIDSLPDKVKCVVTNKAVLKENGIPTDNLVGLTLQEAEKKLIKACLEINNGHRKQTAAMLGISERGLRNKINEYNL